MKMALILLTLSCLATAQSSDEASNSTKSFNYYFQNAKQAYSNDNFDVATGLIEQSIQVSASPTQRIDALNAAGWIAFSKGDYEQSRIRYAEAEQVENVPLEYPTKGKLQYNKAILEYVAGDLDKARLMFNQEGMVESPTSQLFLQSIAKDEIKHEINQHIQQGVLYRYEKNFAKAIESYDKALGLAPQNVEALEFKGYALLRLGQLEESQATLAQAYKIDPYRYNTVLNALKVACLRSDTDHIKKLVSENTLILQNNKANLQHDKELQRMCGEKFSTIVAAL